MGVRNGSWPAAPLAVRLTTVGRRRGVWHAGSALASSLPLIKALARAGEKSRGRRMSMPGNSSFRKRLRSGNKPISLPDRKPRANVGFAR